MTECPAPPGPVPAPRRPSQTLRGRVHLGLQLGAAHQQGVRGFAWDVTVYGLSLGANPSAVPATIATDDPPASGPRTR